MNLLRLKNVSTAIKATVKHAHLFRPTIDLSILETRLIQCRNLRQFNQILSQMIFTGYLRDAYAASRLLKFSTDSTFVHLRYSRCIFDHLENSNGFVWNTMMRASVQRGSPQDAIFLYRLMLSKDVVPDNHTYPILVHASALRLSDVEGRQMHSHVLKLAFDSDVYVQNTLINMYSVCGDMGDAERVFDESPVRDLVSWNSILAGYVQTGNVDDAKRIFDQMPKRNTIATNSMIVLLGKMGCMEDACKLFNEMDEKDMVSWSAVISCYEQNGMCEAALAMFKRMCDSGIMLDEVVVISVLSACAQLSVGETGKLTHGLSIKLGFEFYINLQNALIYMYSKCQELFSAEKLFHANYAHLDQISWNSMISGYLRSGLVENAKAIFDSMPERDVVSWSAMISGYAQHDCFSETLDLFQEMQIAGIRPDEVIMVSVLSACTHLAALDQGKWIHAYINREGLKVNVRLGTTLIDMYMKCGCIDNALDIFCRMEDRGVSTWNAAICGLAMNGMVERSLELFQEMKNSGVVPNEITFIGVLGACRHMGLVDEGQRHFDSMLQEFNVEPNVKHYGCLVDLLGRAGRLKEAEDLLESMPMSPDVSTWGALLGACRKHGDVEMGERIGRKLIELQPDHDGFHVLLSNVYASKGNWENVIEIRNMMMEHGVMKTPGCSMIEAGGTVHEFLAGDRTHPEIDAIDKKMSEMATRLKMAGYVPDTNEVFLEIDEEEKETSLFRHSEKLAVAFGLLNIPSPMPIRILKNLRICNDCHTSFKFVSRAYDREIVVRDRHRFHHFKQGACSCMDFW